MPLRTITEPDPASLLDQPERFFIFYSSVVEGKLWCPDCVVVDDLLQQTFSSADSPDALIIYVGDRPTWKASSNAFRSDPWKVSDIPTIIKVQNGKEVARLVDTEIAEKLVEFIKTD